MVGKRFYCFISYTSLLALLVVGCVSCGLGSGAEVTFEQLFSNPDKYNGKRITIEGFAYIGFEAIVLAEELRYSGYAEGHLVPSERMLWIEGGIPMDIHNKLYEQTMMGPTERYGKILATGIFNYGGQYGHVGAYKYQIIASEIQLLEWSPP